MYARYEEDFHRKIKTIKIIRAIAIRINITTEAKSPTADSSVSKNISEIRHRIVSNAMRTIKMPVSTSRFFLVCFSLMYIPS